MSDGIPLGTIAGLPVRANWSVLVLLWLFAWSLATTLPQTVPGYHTRDYWVAGVIGAVVLLMSLLAHEATHAVVARRAGMEVSSVTLWISAVSLESRAKPRLREPSFGARSPVHSPAFCCQPFLRGWPQVCGRWLRLRSRSGWRGGCPGSTCCWRCSICCRARPWTAAGSSRRFCGVDTATRPAPPSAPPAPAGCSRLV